ncbi:hypothetical protein JXO59_13180, partial [candidate division KSB1 bacterium]|nr:hypothetical protein [candidate division KSB1 bacterium]
MQVLNAKYFVWIVITCFGIPSMYAQVSPFASDVRGSAGPNGIRFRQELNTYVWQMDLRRQFQWRDKWQFMVREQFKSSMLRLSPKEDKWKDEQDLTAALHYRLLPKFKLQSLIQSIAFFDKQSGLNNDIRSLTFGLGFNYAPNRHFNIKGSAGPRWEMRLNQNDAGQYYALDAVADAIDWGGYRNHANVMLAIDDYGRRTNHDAQLQYRVG